VSSVGIDWFLLLVIITSERIEVGILLSNMEDVDSGIPVIDLKNTILRVPDHERCWTDLLTVPVSWFGVTNTT
jgi:hypothetical protein